MLFYLDNWLSVGRTLCRRWEFLYAPVRAARIVIRRGVLAESNAKKKQNSGLNETMAANFSNCTAQRERRTRSAT